MTRAFAIPIILVASVAACDSRSDSGPPAARPQSPSSPIIGGGPIPKEEIKRVIDSHQDETRQCYESALAQRPELSGTVKVSFTIDPQGRVSEWSSDAEEAMSDVAQCLLQRVQSWRFPPPLGGGVVSVNYPFVFAPSGRPEADPG